MRIGMIAVLCLVMNPVFAATFDRMVVVGDSLSDPGNIFAITGAIPGVDARPPSPPYFAGRFSNGPIWTEYLADRLGLADHQVANLALGGAFTDGHVALNDVPEPVAEALRAAGVGGIEQQADIYLANGRPVPAGGLYVVWGGANDYLRGVAGTTPDGTPTPVANLVDTIEDFADAGAERFLVPNLPDLGATPAGGGDPALSAVTAAHNAALGVALAELAGRRDLAIFELDVAAYFAAAESFGFANVTVPCIDPAVSCDDALFFDGLHPTTAAHAELARLAATTVPVPGALPLMATALAGLAWWRRQRVAAA